MEPLKPETALPQFAPLLFDLFKITVDGKPLSDGAKIVYSRLLGRRGLSEKSGWVDEIGTYVIYPVEELAKDTQKGKRAVLGILDTLESIKLIHRKRTGFQSANRIYVFLPVVQENAPMDSSAENCTTEVQISSPMRCKKMHPSIRNRIEDKSRSTSTHSKHCYGEFKNVLLTDEEYQKLGEKFSDRDSRIDDLSYYIASKGAKYKDHYKTVLAWARNDAKNVQARPAEPERKILT